ncbi:MAG: hypothetical protein ABR597_12370 [Bacteroidales bacterium]
MEIRKLPGLKLYHLVGKKTKTPENSNGNDSVRIIPIHAKKFALFFAADYCYCDRRTVDVRS